MAAAPQAPVLRPWLWLRYQGEALYHQRRVVGGLASSATQATDPDEVIGISPDGDPEQIDLSGASRDIEAWRWSEVHRPPPPGIPRGQVYRFPQEPVGAALVALKAAAVTYCDDAYRERERAAGLPAVVPASGSLIEAVWPPPAAPAAAAAPAGGLAAAPLALAGAPLPGHPALGAGAGAAAPLALPGPAAPGMAAAGVGAAAPLALPGPAALGMAAPLPALGAPAVAPPAAPALVAPAPAVAAAAPVAGAPAPGALQAAAPGAVAVAAPYPVLVTVEATALGPRGSVIVANGSETMTGDIGIHVAPSFGAVLIRRIRSDQVQEFKGLEAAGDARLLGIISLNGVRSRRPWREVVASLSEVPFPDWGVEGPRTTLWCCRWIDRRGGGPLDHHRFFVMIHRLNKDSWGVTMHEFGLKALETLGSYDSLDLPNVAGIEALMREVQVVEYAYAKHDSFSGSSAEGADAAGGKNKKGRGRGRGGAAGAFGYLDEFTAFRGQRETGDAMVCPTLVEWVGKQVERDANILKQVRKAREERAGTGQGSG